MDRMSGSQTPTPPNPYVEILISIVMVLGGRAFKEGIRSSWD